MPSSSKKKHSVEIEKKKETHIQAHHTHAHMHGGQQRSTHARLHSHTQRHEHSRKHAHTRGGSAFSADLPSRQRSKGLHSPKLLLITRIDWRLQCSRTGKGKYCSEDGVPGMQSRLSISAACAGVRCGLSLACHPYGFRSIYR